jgi:hypothetical protein
MTKATENLQAQMAVLVDALSFGEPLLELHRFKEVNNITDLAGVGLWRVSLPTPLFLFADKEGPPPVAFGVHPVLVTNVSRQRWLHFLPALPQCVPDASPDAS